LRVVSFRFFYLHCSYKPSDPMLKEMLKRLLDLLPFAVTKNQLYDRHTRRILKKAMSNSTCAVDVGCHKGEIMDLFVKFAPEGYHFGFEPIPDFYQALIIKYTGSKVTIYDYALGDSAGSTSFNYVKSNPAYSGIKKRKYDRPEEEDIEIQVKIKRMDELIPADKRIGVIKIDVEGAELGVLKGAEKIIARDKPLIIFEHGLGAADVYGTSPDTIFKLICETYGMNLSTLSGWLKGETPLNEATFRGYFESGDEYYFIAYPHDKSKFHFLV
jgi:FkbM family methyltransferase